MEFRVLGPVEVLDGDQPIALGGLKQQTVLGLLLADAGRPVSVDRLIEALWGDEPPERAKGTIQTYVSNLRRLVGDRIEYFSNGYLLDVDSEEVDAKRFARLVDEGRRLVDDDPDEAVSVLREALNLWRGRPFSDLDVPDLLPFVTSLEEKRLIALGARIDADLIGGREAEVVGELVALCEQYPMRERFRYLHMLALYRTGRQAEALRAFQETRRHLGGMGIEPSTELAELEQKILEHAPSLDRPGTRPTSAVSTLPRPRTRLIGRDHDVKELIGLLEENRLVTFTGVGGSGKTRLGIEVGTVVEDQVPDGVFFIDLSAVSDDSGLAREMSRQMGIRMGAFSEVDDPLDEWVMHLSRQELLLIVDNCEHLLGECARVVDEVLNRCEGVTVLATSREPLGLDGERVWLVRSLSTEDGSAVELLGERISAIRTDFDFEGSKDDLAVIARRLDGMPLALELAAPRIAYLGAAEVLARLDDRFRLLVGGRNRARRQQTLQATLDWSHDLLDDAERVLLRRLAVFWGGFDLEAIENVAAEPGEDTVDLLGSLVDKSMVILDYSNGQPRYRLLETVRAYAEERLAESGEAADIRSRHRDWYLAWVKRHTIDGALNDFRVVDRLEVEYDNLRAGIEWSVETAEWDQAADQLLYMLGLAYFRAHHEETRVWADAIVHGTEDGTETNAVARIARDFSFVLDRNTRADTPDDMVRGEVIEAMESLPEDHPGRFVACHDLWAAASVLPDAEEMIKWANAGQRAAELAGLTAGKVFARGMGASGHLFAGDYERAAAVWYDVEVRSWNPALTLFLVATASFLANDTTRAQAVFDNADWDPSNPDLCLGEMALALTNANLGDLEAARDSMKAAARALRSMRWARPLAGREVLVGFALITMLEGDLETAMRHIAAARSGTTTHITGTPGGVALWQHCSRVLKERLNPDVRQRLIVEGSQITVDDAIDEQLARS